MIFYSIFFLSTLIFKFIIILQELINTGIIVILYFIGFIVQLAAWSGYHQTSWLHVHKGSNIAAGVFGLFNTLVYTAGMYLLFIESKSPST